MKTQCNSFLSHVLVLKKGVGGSLVPSSKLLQGSRVLSIIDRQIITVL